MKSRGKIEFGDFQTPLALARDVVASLARMGVDPESIVEPTCGVGAFLLAAAERFPRARLSGWEINPDYVARAVGALTTSGVAGRAVVRTGDFFTQDWDAVLREMPGHVLVLGNPPWVTNAGVAVVSGSNVPTKENFHGLRGIEALTGKSNFDISEWMLLRLLRALRLREGSIAVLCKTSTARKVLRFAWRNEMLVSAASLRRIDAKAHFGAAVDACLFFVRTGTRGLAEAEVFDRWDAEAASSTLGLVRDDLVADIRAYDRLRRLEGFSPYQWRSGLKHDCSPVMELTPEVDGSLRNEIGEQLALEPEFLFPLLKCTDLFHGRTAHRRFVIVPQRKVGEDTAPIATTAPLTWRYLETHRDRFEARKSSIYKRGVPFGIFGIGEYSFAPWKVAVSGLHRAPRFVPVGPADNKPVMFDDTCYFLSFDYEAEARVVAALLNSEPCREFMASLIFPDSKRPITVDLLQRLNLRALAVETGMEAEWNNARNRVERATVERTLFQSEFVMEGRATD